MGGKRGWMRIMEAVIAIIILSGVLLVVYSNNIPNKDDSAIVYDMQVKILDDIALSSTLRNATLNSNESYVQPALANFVSNSIPENYGHLVKVCNFNSTSCLLGITVKGGVYVEDRIISSNLYFYEPKIVRLFIWLKEDS